MVNGQKNLSTMVVDYDVIINGHQKKAKMFVSSNESIFYILNEQKKRIDETEQLNEYGEANVNIKLNSGMEATRIVFTSKTDKCVMSSHFVYYCGEYEGFMVRDSLKQIDWSFESEKKQIGPYLCSKAKAKVRGREYTCWFTPDLPLFFGPWRLHGLPGAVVQATDRDGFVVFSLSGYKLKAESSPVELPDFEVISCQQLMSMKTDEADEIISKIQSRLPRSATFTTTNINTNYLELECD